MAPVLIAPGLMAQNWQAVGGLNMYTAGQVGDLYGDTVLDKLFLGTQTKWMFQNGDTIEMHGCVTWDGLSWEPFYPYLQTCTNGNVCSSVYNIFRYQNRLYANGGFAILNQDSIWSDAYARLSDSGDAWIDLQCPVPATTGITYIGPMESDGLLFATGYDGELCGSATTNVLQYDGTSFAPFEPFADLHSGDNDYVGLVFKFQDQWYMTGLLDDTIAGVTYGFARYNGNGWESVPGFEEPAPIKDILIHNDTLYVCGYFFEGPGSPGNMVAIYDGQQWNNLGGGTLLDLNGSTLGIGMRLLWWHDKLLFSGEFHYAGGVPIEHIAQWNGHQWCGSGADFDSENAVTSLTTWRDTLYIAGGFDAINGVHMQQVAQWVGGDFDAVCSPSVGLPEWKPIRTLPIQLLDAAGLWSVPTTAGQQLQVTDAMGTVVVALLARANASMVVDLRTQAAGLYVVRVMDSEGNSATVKVLKP